MSRSRPAIVAPHRIAEHADIDGAMSELFSEPGPAMLLIEVERGNQHGIKPR